MIDHFYIVVSENTFESLVNLSYSLKILVYKKTTREDSTYEGLYIQSSCGMYFEILKKSEYYDGYTFGLAFGEYSNSTKNLDLYFNNDTILTREMIKIDGKPWFECIYPKGQSKAFVWFMEYQNEQVEKRKSKANSTVHRFKFDRLEMSNQFTNYLIESFLKNINQSFNNNSIDNFLYFTNTQVTFSLAGTCTHEDYSFRIDNIYISIVDGVFLFEVN